MVVSRDGLYVGEVANAKAINRKGGGSWSWLPCEKCGKLRWVILEKSSPAYQLCLSCRQLGHPYYAHNHGKRKDNPNWKGGRSIVGGYCLVSISPDDYYYPMTKRNGRVLEHRLVMAKHLGRCLNQWEIVHHKNHDKLDNRIENLQLMSTGRHTQLTILENRVKQLEGRVTILEAENAMYCSLRLST